MAARLILAGALLMLGPWLPSPSASASTSSSASPPAAIIARSEVLNGTATEKEALAAAGVALRAAGGERIPDQEASAPPDASGGAHPLLALDLDGDGDEESILLQPGSSFLAVDERGTLWRERLDRLGASTVGFLTEHLSEHAGRELLFVGIRLEPSSRSLVLASYGVSGLIWTRTFPGNWGELTGAVEADHDPTVELVVSVWDASGLRIHVVDGESGTTLREVRSTAGAVGSTVSESAFVTDGPAGQSDEVVFVTRLGLGYTAERSRLTDGEVLAREFIPLAPGLEVYQGSDYTGDGRRDAYVVQLFWPPPPVPPPPPGAPQRWSYGVLDANTLDLRWMREIPSEGNAWFVPYPGGDVDGDGAYEVCHVIQDSEPPDEMHTARAQARCESGRTGTTLWHVSREVTAKSVYAFAEAVSDLDGDDFPDPVLHLVGWECREGWWECPTTVDEAVAFSGEDSSLIWKSDYTTIRGYSPTSSDLDGVPGDDFFFPQDPGGPDGPFAVVNGRSLGAAWYGTVRTGEMEGWAVLGMGADVNGDGRNEAVVTAAGVEFVDDPACAECRRPVVHAFVSALRPGGSTLWNFEH